MDKVSTNTQFIKTERSFAFEDEENGWVVVHVFRAIYPDDAPQLGDTNKPKRTTAFYQCNSKNAAMMLVSGLRHPSDKTEMIKQMDKNITFAPITDEDIAWGKRIISMKNIEWTSDYI